MHNGGRGAAELTVALLAEIGETMVGVSPPRYPEPVAGVVLDPARYVGSYAREGMEYRVAEKDGALEMTIVSTSPLSVDDEPTVVSLLAHDDRVLLAKLPHVDVLMPAVFFDHEGGRYLHLGARTTKRT
jgi:hypothetical protein